MIKKKQIQAYTEHSFILAQQDLENGEGNGNPLQYSCLGNPTDRGATVYGVTKESDMTWQLNNKTWRKEFFCLWPRKIIQREKDILRVLGYHDLQWSNCMDEIKQRKERGSHSDFEGAVPQFCVPLHIMRASETLMSKTGSKLFSKPAGTILAIYTLAERTSWIRTCLIRISLEGTFPEVLKMAQWSEVKWSGSVVSDSLRSYGL